MCVCAEHIWPDKIWNYDYLVDLCHAFSLHRLYQIICIILNSQIRKSIASQSVSQSVNKNRQQLGWLHYLLSSDKNLTEIFTPFAIWFSGPPKSRSHRKVPHTAKHFILCKISKYISFLGVSFVSSHRIVYNHIARISLFSGLFVIVAIAWMERRKEGKKMGKWPEASSLLTLAHLSICLCVQS